MRGHVTTVEAWGNRFRATCSCGWRMKRFPESERVANEAAAAHEVDAPRVKCGKTCFASKADADEAVVNAKIRFHLRGNRKRLEQRSYHCEACDAWHLTSKPLRVSA